MRSDQAQASAIKARGFSLLNVAAPEAAVFHSIMSDAIEVLVAWQCNNPRLPAIIEMVEARTRGNCFPRAMATLACVKAQIAP